MTVVESGHHERLEAMAWCENNGRQCVFGLADQVRLVLHIAAFWSMLDVRDTFPNVRDLAKAESNRLRLRPLDVVSRIVGSRPRRPIALAGAGPAADVIAGLSTRSESPPTSY